MTQVTARGPLADADVVDTTLAHGPVPGEALAPAAAVLSVSLDPDPPESLLANEAVVRRALAVADVTTMATVLMLVLSQLGTEVGAFVALASVPIVVLVFKIAGLYNRDELRLGHSTLEEVPILLQLTGLFTLVVAITLPIFARSPSGAQLAALWLGSLVAVVMGRVLARSATRRVLSAERCLIVGNRDQAERIRARIAVSRTRARVVHCLTGEELGRLGGPQIIRRLVHDMDLHRLIIVPVAEGSDLVEELIRVAKAVGVRVSVLPGIVEVVGSGVAFDEVDGITMLGVPHFGLSRSSRLLKRAFDLVLTTIGLLLLSPLLAVIALAIRLDSKGPILFRQIRVGHKGRHFFVLKFRSMVADADARKDELRSLNVAGPGLFKVQDDPRVTRVGSLLRSTSLDELPQLFNVMRGDMSLVGPRPLVTDEDAQVLGLDRSRLRLYPGMTGPWQLGSRVPLNEMVDIDYLYASHWTLWLDVKLLLHTVRHVVRRQNF
jgi:exopolysaccharide biosynthesis polyprenyl glycosylphosphotransferase